MKHSANKFGLRILEKLRLRNDKPVETQVIDESERLTMDVTRLRATIKTLHPDNVIGLTMVGADLVRATDRLQYHILSSEVAQNRMGRTSRLI